MAATPIGVALPKTLPETHRRFLEDLVAVLGADQRIAGVACGGSFASDSMDPWSDLDLVIGVAPADYPAILAERAQIAGSVGHLLAAFTGEHVGEPRLLICLYQDPSSAEGPLHVDLKFVALPDLADRIEDPVVLWERAGRFSDALAAGVAHYPAVDRQWIEDRFWIWVHYTASKIGRGELLETIDSLAYLRRQVLGPLGAEARGHRPSGLRRIERLMPDLAQSLRATLAGHDPADCLRALRATIDLYHALRSRNPPPTIQRAAERAALDYLARVDRAFPAG